MNGTTLSLAEFYAQVQATASLHNLELAERWTDAVLATLGFHLGGKAKKALGQALPAELKRSLGRVFWLLHFRDSTLSRQEFQKQVARRAGHTDAAYALRPILAVFQNVKRLIDPDVSRQVTESLAPDIRALWEQA